MEEEEPKSATPEAWPDSAPHHYLLHTVVKKGQARVLVADEGALLDEADEDLRLGELGVELLVGAVSAFQKPCREAGERSLVPDERWAFTLK